MDQQDHPSKHVDLERVKAACQTLIEHFDTVQIFCTRCESGELDGTVSIKYGKGNWFGRYGQVRSWLEEEDEDLRRRVRGEGE